MHALKVLKDAKEEFLDSGFMQQGFIFYKEIFNNVFFKNERGRKELRMQEGKYKYYTEILKI